MAEHLRNELCLDALKRAAANRRRVIPRAAAEPDITF
jgi:hypothetical protein